MKRYGFPLRLAACFAAAAAIVAIVAAFGCGPAKSPDSEGWYPPLGNFADLYLRGSYDILHMIKSRELGKIGEAARIATVRKLAGGEIRSSIWTPHIMYAGACDETMPGNPNIAPDYRWGHPQFQKVDDLKSGDVLIVAHPGYTELRERGVYIIGIGYPMATNRYSPPNFNDNPDRPVENFVDMMIYDWCPKEDGLVTPALTPNLKICPTSPVTVLGYWLLTAQIAYDLAHTDTSGTSVAAEAYLDTLMTRLASFHRKHIGMTDAIARNMADRILNGGKLYPFSSRQEFYQEANGTAGSLMGIYPIHPDGTYSGPGIHTPAKFDSVSLTDKDILIVALGGNTPEMEQAAAMEARKRGSLVIGIYPFAWAEENGPVRDLAAACDYRIDNLSGDRWGVLDIPGYETTVIPAAGLMNNYAFWMIIGAYVQEMERRGEAPYYWMSWHVPGGKAYDDSIQSYFLKRGY